MANDPHLADSSNSPARELRVVVAGCGVSGLATALYLLQQSDLNVASIDLIDPRSRPGGVISSFQSDGYTLEAAAQGVLASRQTFAALVDELQLGRSVVASPTGLRRYLIRGGRRVAISPLPLAWVTSGLISLGGLVRFFLEPFRPRSLDAVHETLVAFCSRRFGSEWARHFMVPLATGIWAGGAGRLLARHAFPRLVEWELKSGSVIRGALSAAIRTAWSRRRHKKRHRAKGRSAADLSTRLDPQGQQRKGLLTFDNGMGFFAEELAKHIARLAEEKGTHLQFHFAESVQSAQRALSGHENPTVPVAGGLNLRQSGPTTKALDSQKPWLIETNTGKRLVADLFFNTAPPWSSTIEWNWGAFGEERWARLAAQPTHGVVVVGLGGNDTQDPACGFGALAAEDSSGLLGVLYVHSIAPKHAPSGHFLYRLMLGGDRCPEMVTWSEEHCITRARAELLQLGLVTPAAAFTFEKVFRWENAIPIADSGHDARLQAIRELEVAFGGLFFAGNYLNGVGVDDCLVSAKEAVLRSVQYIRTQGSAAQAASPT